MPFWFPDLTTAVVGSLGRSHLCFADTSNNVSNVCWRTGSQYQTRLLTTKGGTPSGLLRGPMCFQWNCNVGLGAISHFLDILHTHSSHTDTNTYKNVTYKMLETLKWSLSGNRKPWLLITRNWTQKWIILSGWSKKKKKTSISTSKHHRWIHWKCRDADRIQIRSGVNICCC